MTATHRETVRLRHMQSERERHTHTPVLPQSMFLDHVSSEKGRGEKRPSSKQDNLTLITDCFIVSTNCPRSFSCI